MAERALSRLDKLICGVDNALRTLVAPAEHRTRPNPARDVPEVELTEAQTVHAAGLMRVNHAGEIAAQALYQGHAAVARDPALEAHLSDAAREEYDHLGWCEERLRELGSQPSLLGPLWYAGAFAVGAASGVLGDRWSLGFIQETEKQVSDHLTDHLDRLPAEDLRSRAIVRQMREEEEQHGANAADAGAATLPPPLKRMMRMTAKILTSTAYRV